MKRALFAVFGILVAGCATSPEVTAWNMAREVNTPAAYQDFVRRYPESGHVDEAREMLGKSERERIRKAGSVAECAAILKTNPDPESAALAGELAFKAAQSETSVDALYQFLEYFPGHAGVTAVRARIEELEFTNAASQPSGTAMEYFLYRYPGSRFAAEGRRLLQEKSFRQVKEWGSQYGYKAFVARFPDSVHTPEVRSWIRPTAPAAALSNVPQALSDAVAKSPALKRHACALALSSAVRGNGADADTLRRLLHELETAPASAALPAACTSAGLKAKPGLEANLGEALRTLSTLEEQRADLAGRWEIYREREEMVKAAIAASSSVANELETAELSEDVLGTGPLGRLDAGAEKGS
ncbi:MAG: tetratricopeptide repeat protein, partial [Verrucomicrobiota bacterium]